MSQLTGVNKRGKTGIHPNHASTDRRRGRLRVSSGERRESGWEADGRAGACRGRRAGVRAGARVDRVTFSKCGPLGGVVGSSLAAPGLSVPRVRLTPTVISIKICSYHLIKNIPFMIRYRPACNGGR